MRVPPHRLIPLAIGAVGLLLLPACGDDDDDAGDDTVEPGHVNVLDNYFDPETVDVSVGDTVTWDFKGGAVHNVVGDGFKSANLGKGKTFEHEFNSAGTYDYQCTLHPGMNGTVEVS